MTEERAARLRDLWWRHGAELWRYFKNGPNVYLPDRRSNWMDLTSYDRSAPEPMPVIRFERHTGYIDGIRCYQIVAEGVVVEGPIPIK